MYSKAAFELSLNFSVFVIYNINAKNACSKFTHSYNYPHALFYDGNLNIRNVGVRI